MTWHWIVVGAGSAGCVLANRLSENADRRVTLIETGPDLVAGAVPPGIDGPNFFAALDEPGRKFENLLASRVLGGERTLYQRGRGVGGSSAVNAMVALRGSVARYRSWGWADMTAAWERVALVSQRPQPDELGAVSQALLQVDERAQVAELTRRDGRRVTSAEAYLWPVLDRPNLTIRASASVDAVLLANRRATGVRLTDGAEISADRVIVAAGAIHSPAILLRSGVDTPGLGEGLQDHPSVVFTLQLRPGVDQDISGLPIGSVLHLPVGDDLIQLLPMSSVGTDPESAGFGALLVALMTPVGRAGSVGIDGDGAPVVDFALLQADRDRAALTAGIDLAREVLRQPAFSDIIEQVYIDDQGTTVDALDDDEVLSDWVSERCGDYVHAASSCAMGAVVDERGAVQGYDDLFVCDASIFPEIPDANTHLPTTMLAERQCFAGRLES